MATSVSQYIFKIGPFFKMFLVPVRCGYLPNSIFVFLFLDYSPMKTLTHTDVHLWTYWSYPGDGDLWTACKIFLLVTLKCLRIVVMPKFTSTHALYSFWYVIKFHLSTLMMINDFSMAYEKSLTDKYVPFSLKKSLFGSLAYYESLCSFYRLITSI